MESSTVTSKGQLVIPSRLRKRYGIKAGTRVCFVEKGNEIVFQPVTKEYLRSIHGMLGDETSAVEELLRDRAKDKEQEERKLGKRSS
jgi:AbrB family looped-hinge helix DNA binding protein